MHKQIIKDDPIVRRRLLAWLALAVTTAVLLAPGSAVQATLSLVEPALEVVRQWISSWWQWPASEPGQSGLALDKIIHFVLFAVCAVLVCMAWHTTFKALHILLFLLAFGVLTEMAQYFIPGRSMSLGDMIADSFGTMAGMAMWRWFLFDQSVSKS